MGEAAKAESDLVIYLMIVSAFSICVAKSRSESGQQAKPIITSPPITSTNFTGRDYLRVQRTAARNLHNGHEFCTDTPA